MKNDSVHTQFSKWNDFRFVLGKYKYINERMNSTKFDKRAKYLSENQEHTKELYSKLNSIRTYFKKRPIFQGFSDTMKNDIQEMCNTSISHLVKNDFLKKDTMVRKGYKEEKQETTKNLKNYTEKIGTFEDLSRILNRNCLNSNEEFTYIRENDIDTLIHRIMK